MLRKGKNCWLAVALLFAVITFAYGDGWVQQNSGTTNGLLDVHFPENAEVGYAVGAGGTILKTTDGGATWTAQNSGTTRNLRGVYFLDNSTGFAVGDNGTALKTTDGGGTWTTMNVGTTDNLTDVAFPGTRGIGYISSVSRQMASKIHKTTNYGGNWTALTIPGSIVSLQTLHFLDEQIGFAAGLNGYIIRTTDGGSSFTWLPPGTSEHIMTVAFVPGNPAVGFFAGSNGMIRQTQDTGSTWQELFIPPPPGGTFNALCIPVNVNNIYLGGADGYIARCINTTMWTQQNTGTTSTIFAFSFPEDELTGYAVGGEGLILKTTTGGMAIKEKSVVEQRKMIEVRANPVRQSIMIFARTRTPAVLFDAIGRQVRQLTLEKGVNRVQVEHSGVYLLVAGEEQIRVVVTD